MTREEFLSKKGILPKKGDRFSITHDVPLMDIIHVREYDEVIHLELEDKSVAIVSYFHLTTDHTGIWGSMRYEPQGIGAILKPQKGEVMRTQDERRLPRKGSQFRKDSESPVLEIAHVQTFDDTVTLELEDMSEVPCMYADLWADSDGVWRTDNLQPAEAVDLPEEGNKFMYSLHKDPSVIVSLYMPDSTRELRIDTESGYSTTVKVSNFKKSVDGIWYDEAQLGVITGALLIQTPTTELGAPAVATPVSDEINHPSHYADNFPMEVWDMKDVLTQFMAENENVSAMVLSDFSHSFKYRMRAGQKGNTDEDIVRDIRKAQAWERRMQQKMEGNL